MTAGYSGTPLAKKLGIEPGSTVAIGNEPKGFRNLLEPIPADVEFRPWLRGKVAVSMLFVTRRSELERRIGAGGRVIFPSGGLWVAWPKKASKVPTDMTEDVVREVGLPLGMVDNKVAAIDETWSGLRLVWRKEHRQRDRPPQL